MTIAAATGVALTAKRRKGGDNKPKTLPEYIEEAMVDMGRRLAEEGVERPRLTRRRMAQARREGMARWREAQK